MKKEVFLSLLLLTACAAVEEERPVVAVTPSPPAETASCTAVHDAKHKVSLYQVAIPGTRKPLEYSLPWEVFEKREEDSWLQAGATGRIAKCVRSDPPPPVAVPR